MKAFLLLILITLFSSLSPSWSQTRFVDASELTLIGKAMPTKHPFHRVDTAVYKGLTASENQQARSTAGMALVFSTNSSFIDVRARYIWEHRKDNMTGIASSGFDLYIKDHGRWVYAGTGVAQDRNRAVRIVNNMDRTLKECLLYLPIYSELERLEIGVGMEAVIQSIPNPFKVKTVFFGSSFTQGTAASRPGMSYPMQLQRRLNLDVCNLGFAGNSRLQPYFANVLAAVQADAFVFDAFSNPTAALIKERLEPFVEKLVKAHPHTPLIFVETIHRGKANFDQKVRADEAAKRAVARRIMGAFVRRYTNVYLVTNPLPAAQTGDTSADGVHPSDMGYQLWAQNLGEQLIKLLHLKKQ
ncbi:SGNH/GDSL hydrolase family protein [Niabella aurantiaca]|uniref:SGNH/GDSL hydrolase family protein n=1 Tax=Niabella aurantiaca TaxID=379900 RepID=UPI000477FD08|nr:SGNH/GDSL hydrolase family protein [Niabella aurantiaca]